MHNLLDVHDIRFGDKSIRQKYFRYKRNSFTFLLGIKTDFKINFKYW